MGRPVANWPCLSPPPNAVYFLKKGHHDGGKQRDGNRPNEGEGESSSHAANKIRDGGGRIERGAVAPVPSNERSSFPPHDNNDSEEHACAFARRGDLAVLPTPLLPKFPCSPIAMRDSSSSPG